MKISSNLITQVTYFLPWNSSKNKQTPHTKTRWEFLYPIFSFISFAILETVKPMAGYRIKTSLGYLCCCSHWVARFFFTRLPVSRLASLWAARFRLETAQRTSSPHLSNAVQRGSLPEPICSVGLQHCPGRQGAALSLWVCVCVLVSKSTVCYMWQREADAYRLPVRRKGQKEVGGKAVGRKVWGFDGSENESNLKGVRGCENEDVLLTVHWGEGEDLQRCRGRWETSGEKHRGGGRAREVNVKRVQLFAYMKEVFSLQTIVEEELCVS